MQSESHQQKGEEQGHSQNHHSRHLSSTIPLSRLEVVKPSPFRWDSTQCSQVGKHHTDQGGSNDRSALTLRPRNTIARSTMR